MPKEKQIATIHVTETTDGTFNVFGTTTDLFVLQGNLCYEEVVALHATLTDIIANRKED